MADVERLEELAHIFQVRRLEAGAEFRAKSFRELGEQLRTICLGPRAHIHVRVDQAADVPIGVHHGDVHGLGDARSGVGRYGADLAVQLSSGVALLSGRWMAHGMTAVSNISRWNRSAIRRTANSVRGASTSPDAPNRADFACQGQRGVDRFGGRGRAFACCWEIRSGATPNRAQWRRPR